MAEQHDKVLAALGVGADVIKKLNDITPEQLKEFKAEDYTTPVVQTFETKFLNDNTFLSKLTAEKLPESILKTIEKGQYARFLKEMTDVAQHELGLDITKFSDDQKKGLKDFFRKATADYGLLKANDPKTLQDLQTQLQTALSEKSIAEKNIETKVTEAATSAQKKSAGVIEKLIVKGLISNIEGYKLKANPDYIIDALIGKVKSKYVPVLNDDSIKLMQKENDKLPALTADGKELDIKDALVSILNDDKMLDKVEEKKQDETEEERKRRIKVEGDGKASIPSYIQKTIDDNIAAEKKAAPVTT